jgi:TRAP-type mannitol/chloroaromatic compound transport system permease large subunit
MELALTGFAILLLLAFIGVPLAFATLVVGFFGLMYLRGLDAALAVTSQWIVETSVNYNLSIIPLFVLMGAFIHRSGISTDLFGVLCLVRPVSRRAGAVGHPVLRGICGGLRIVAGHRRHDDPRGHPADAQLSL